MARDIRFEDRETPKIAEQTDAIYQNLGHLRMRVRPVALPRHLPDTASRRRWVTNNAA